MDTQADNSNSRNKSISQVLLWGRGLFLLLCLVGFFIALLLALEVPVRTTLLYTLVPAGVFLLITAVLFLLLKYDLSRISESYSTVSSYENYTLAIKTILLPILLVLLYFYVKLDDEAQRQLYTTSPVTCDMVIHPCGSSYKGRTTEVWDAVDLIQQPSENEVFIVTNVANAITQTREACGQTGAYCSTKDINPGERRTPKWLEKTAWSFQHNFVNSIVWNPISCPANSDIHCPEGIMYDNGIQTQDCEKNLCKIQGWCPPVKMEDFSISPIFKTEEFTIFLDLKPNFLDFTGKSWTGGGKEGYSANYASIYAKHYGYERSVTKCVFHQEKDPYCPRFRLYDIIALAGANYEEAATFGGQFKIDVDWSCNFDWGSSIFDCLPSFSFSNRASNKGKPKTFPKLLSQNETHRTLIHSLGINVSISHVGTGKQVQLFNVIMYAQFVYVSFIMIKGPFLWISRCILAVGFAVLSKRSSI